MWPDDETPEPAAWINFNAATGERNVSFECESELASIPLWPEPPRAPRKPLSDDDLRRMWAAYAPLIGGVLDFARAVEAAHGIGDSK